MQEERHTAASSPAGSLEATHSIIAQTGKDLYIKYFLLRT